MQVVLYLVDDEQRSLFPLGTGGRSGPALDVEGTPAGQAFRTLEIPPASADPARMWVPVVHGRHRLGVLEVTTARATDVDEPVLREPVLREPVLQEPVLQEQCGWLATALGSLVASGAGRGGTLDAARRHARRGPASELIWALLPPLGSGTESCQLAGMLAHGDQVAGDIFDYALSETAAAFAIFDVTGRALGAGLLAAAAVAAYRSARRDGRGLADQASDIEQAITTGFGEEAFLTGVLGELDVSTGRLGYLAAGSPYPYLLHDGRATPLTGGRCLPLGVGTGAPRVPGQASLEPGDWLVLPTDGIAKARDEGGAGFGTDRLRDFLEREADPAEPATETVRRLIREVREYQGSALRDDAAVVLIRWAGPGRPAS